MLDRPWRWGLTPRIVLVYLLFSAYGGWVAHQSKYPAEFVANFATLFLAFFAGRR